MRKLETKGNRPAALNQAVPNPPLKCQKSQNEGEVVTAEQSKLWAQQVSQNQTGQNLHETNQRHPFTYEP